MSKKKDKRAGGAEPTIKPRKTEARRFSSRKASDGSGHDLLDTQRQDGSGNDRPVLGGLTQDQVKELTARLPDVIPSDKEVDRICEGLGLEDAQLRLLKTHLRVHG